MGVALTALAGAVGLTGGALTPLTAYRLGVRFDLPDRDACVRCARSLPAGIGGWLRLPARCGGCAARLGPPAWLTGAVGGVAAGALATAIGASPVLALFLALAVVGVLLGAVDVVCKRLPHLVVGPAIVVSAAAFTVLASVTGDWSALLRAGAAALAMAAVYGLLYLLPGRAVGEGDVTLGGLLGLFLGWLGWSYVELGALLPWLVNLPVLLVLLATGRIGRSTTVPFGPAMLVGALLAVLIGGSLDR